MVGKALCLIAFICFVLAAFGVGAAHGVLLVPLGLACWIASALVS